MTNLFLQGRLKRKRRNNRYLLEVLPEKPPQTQINVLSSR
jgi:hypothetical protein